MKICCLTFDDGPSKYTPQVLAALEKCDAKATFLSLHRTRTRIICRI